MQVLDRHDGSYIVRYRMMQSYKDLKIEVLYKGKHVADSPYLLNGLYSFMHFEFYFCHF
jgi:hypothetical protein